MSLVSFAVTLALFWTHSSSIRCSAASYHFGNTYFGTLVSLLPKQTNSLTYSPSPGIDQGALGTWLFYPLGSLATISRNCKLLKVLRKICLRKTTIELKIQTENSKVKIIKFI